MKTQRVTSAQYDVTGHRISRVLKQDFIFRLIPIGNFGGGPNLKFLVELWGLHTFARLYYALKIRLEKPAALLGRAVHVLKRRPG